MKIVYHGTLRGKNWTARPILTKKQLISDVKSGKIGTDYEPGGAQEGFYTPGLHVGTLQAAKDATKTKKKVTPRIFRLRINTGNIYSIKRPLLESADPGDDYYIKPKYKPTSMTHTRLAQLRKEAVESLEGFDPTDELHTSYDKAYKKVAKKHSGIAYLNYEEDPGSISYALWKPEAIASVKQIVPSGRRNKTRRKKKKK